MALNRSERERLSDNRLKLQTVARSLQQIDADKIPHFDEIQECLENAEENLKDALAKPAQS